MDKDLNKKIAIGAFWMILQRFSIKGIAIISTLILVRLLSPQDFGLMALASAIYSFVELVTAFGFDTVLVKTRDTTKEHYNTAWTMQIIFFTLSSIFLVIITPFIADFYNDPRLVNVLYILASVLFINGLINIGIVQFRKELNFRKEYHYRVTIKIIGFIATIPAAFYFRDYNALIFGIFILTLSSLFLSYILSPYRPAFSLTHWKEIMSFSSWLFISNIINFFNEQLPNFILGKITGSGPLGIYSISNEISTIVTTEVVAPINRAAYPGYSKVQDNMDQLKTLFLNIMSHIVIIAAPTTIGLSMISDILVPVALGDKWTDSIVVIQILAITSFFMSMSTNSNYIFLVISRQKIITLLLLIKLLVFIPLIIFLTYRWGLIGAVISILITTVLAFPLTQYFVFRYLKINLVEFYTIVKRPILSTIVMAGSIYLFMSYKTEHIPGFSKLLSLLVVVLLGMITYAGSLYLMWRIAGKPNSAEKWLLDSAKSFLAKKFPRK